MEAQIDKLLSATGDVALRRRAKWILEKIAESRPKKILDLGCGDGFYLHLISQLLPNIEVIGVDPDSNALKSAKRNLSGKNIKLIQGSLPKLNFPDKSFDLILLSEVVEHIDNDLDVLRVVYRKLEPNGKVVISVPNANYPFLWDPINWVLERLFNYHINGGFFAGIWNQHERLYSRKQLVSLLKDAGFNNIDTNVLTRYCLPFNHYLINIIARILVGSNNSKINLLSKFNGILDINKPNFNPFSILFRFDKLNDLGIENNVGVSLVATAVR